MPSMNLLQTPLSKVAGNTTLAGCVDTLKKWRKAMFFIMFRKKNRGHWKYGISAYKTREDAETQASKFQERFPDNEYKVV
jgi:hypothetical protein